MTILPKVHKPTKDAYKLLHDAPSLPDTDVQQKPRDRKTTDIIFLIVFVASIALFLPFLIYTLSYSDINRLKGYDTCGNICGQKNTKYDQWNCTGQDMTGKPFFSYSWECAENQRYGFSHPYLVTSAQNTFNLIRRDVWKVTLVSFIPLALCLILIALFRYYPEVAVWGILAGFWLVMTSIAAYHLGMSVLTVYVVPILIYTFISLPVFCSYVLVNLKYIRLSASLLKEAVRPLFEVKLMSIVPSAALSGLIVIVLICTTNIFYINTAGKLTELHPGDLAYVADKLMLTARILNFITAFLVIVFVLGAQCITVSGVVAQWFTTKDQDSVNDSVFSNLLVTVKYHLGTAALGSVMMIIMFVPRLILQVFAMFSALKGKADFLLRYLDGFFTTNSYVITGMQGTSFVQSGKKAANLLNLSIGDTRDLNSFANSIIQVAQVAVISVSTWAAANALKNESTYSMEFTYIAFALACVIVHAILGTLKVSMNTLFFCSTEELLENKEDSMPITMTMKEFLDAPNNLYLQKVQSRPSANIPEKCFYIKISLCIFVVVSCVLYFIACFI